MPSSLRARSEIIILWLFEMTFTSSSLNFVSLSSSSSAFCAALFKFQLYSTHAALKDLIINMADTSQYNKRISHKSSVQQHHITSPVH
eukprot:m.26340 g.26340  ORF g.26340 m.26340 type:complete len:88 (-) comp13308_c0_seq4:979-1242(-)